MSLNSVQILKVAINSTSQAEVLEKILNFEAGTSLEKKLVIFTPNPEFLVEASKNKDFLEVLNSADINLPDGVGLIWASRFLGKPIKQRVSGADLVEELLKTGNEKKWTIGIVGARKGVLKETEELLKKLKEKYPLIKFVNLDNKETAEKFFVIFACQGMVKQEEWIRKNFKSLPCPVFVGVGGSLDFLAGFTKRAPVFLRQMGLEWLWRGLQRPSHFKRIYKATILFPLLVFKEKLNISR